MNTILKLIKLTIRIGLTKTASLVLAMGFPLLLVTVLGQQSQARDPDFKPLVVHPTYTRNHPKALFDEKHFNLHTANGRYKPFVDLIANDGYQVTPNKEYFNKNTLAGYNVLVIVDPRGAGDDSDLPLRAKAAFSAEECDVVSEWVRKGGSLLLLTDHYPIGSAAANLAKRFGVDMSNGYTEDPNNSDPNSRSQSQLIFSHKNGLLREHPITLGRTPNERINKVIAFTGQSLSVPRGAAVILGLSPTAIDKVPKSVEKVEASGRTSWKIEYNSPISASGRAQAIAFQFGRGRVVITGEAAMLTAQIDESTKKKFGMNVVGLDNQQFALNIMHWLTRLI